MEIIDETEKESASHTDVLSLVKDTVTVVDWILAIFLNRFQVLVHSDYTSSKARPELSAWWIRVKSRDELVLSRMFIIGFIIVTRIYSCSCLLDLYIEIK